MWKPGQLVTIEGTVCQITKAKDPHYSCVECTIVNKIEPVCYNTVTGRNFSMFDCMKKMGHAVYPKTIYPKR